MCFAKKGANAAIPVTRRDLSTVYHLTMRAVHLIPIVFAAGLLSCSSGEKVDSAHTYQMGERAPVGHIIYTVFEKQWQNQLGNGAEARVPQNRFFLVRLSVVNSGGGEVIIPKAELVDDGGTSYPEATDGDGVQDWIGNTRQVRPSETAQGYLLFDVPPKHYKLKLFGEEDKQAALIDIPLSFDSDVPDVTTPLDSGSIPKKK